MNRTSPYSSLESPSSSESSYASSHSSLGSISMAQDTSNTTYAWSSHLQDPIDQRDFDAVNSAQWSGSTLDNDWTGSHTYPYPLETRYNPDVSYAPRLPLHAPVPLPGPSSLLFADSGSFQTSESSNNPLPTPAAPNSPASRSTTTVPAPQQQIFMSSFSVKAPMQATFPTPCELLSELNGPDSASSSGTSPESTSDSSTADASSQYLNPGMSSGGPEIKMVGFTPPEPDAITSHEKKRLYLECLEKYVLYLHDQLKLIGATPTPLIREPTNRGLSSRSIRTLLVHMEGTTAKLNAKTRAEEERFAFLRDAYLRQELPMDAYAAGSVETGEYYSGSMQSQNRPYDSVPNAPFC